MNLEKIARAMGQVITWDGDPASHTLTKQELADLAQAALTAMFEGFAGDGVTEGDRDAAASTSPHNERWGMLVRAGALDNDPIVQAFARHRQLSAAAERARIVAGVRACELSSAIPEDPAQIVRELADAIERGEV